MTLPAIISSLAVALSLSGPSPVDYVNCFLGTGGMGHTFPGATVPFGGVQLSPDTDTIPHNVNGQYQKRAYEYCAGYRYSDKSGSIRVQRTILTADTGRDSTMGLKRRLPATTRLFSLTMISRSN